MILHDLLLYYLYLSNILCTVLPATTFKAFLSKPSRTYLRRNGGRLAAEGHSSHFVSDASSSFSREEIHPPVKASGPVDYLIFVVHGIGATEENLAKYSESLKHTLEVTRRHSFKKVPCEFHLEMINWKRGLADEQAELITPLIPPSRDDVKSSREWATGAAADILFYAGDKDRKHRLLKSVSDNINEAYHRLMSEDAEKYKNSKIALIGYSLGSMILYDVLNANCLLDFKVSSFFLWGSPLSAYLALTQSPTSIEIPETLRGHYFNVFHPLDPLAFRQEPLVYGEAAQTPVVIPRWFTDQAHIINATRACPPRIDYVLKVFQVPKQLGSTIVGIAMLSSHFAYWNNRDLAFFILARLTGFNPTEPPF